MSYANGRVVLALEGGYDLAAISDSAEECVKVVIDFLINEKEKPKKASWLDANHSHRS